MLNCPDCQARNSADSQFCKACGVALPADLVAEAKAQMDQLNSDGYKAFNDGRVEEARLIAERILGESPDHVGALSLKGMALERAGRLAEAMDAFERVVELNPNSALDRIKIQQLRNSLAAQTVAMPVPPNRSKAAIAAVAAVLFVVSLGVAFAMYLDPSRNGNAKVVEPGQSPERLIAMNDANGGRNAGAPLSTDNEGTKPGGAPNATEPNLPQGGNTNSRPSGAGSPSGAINPGGLPPVGGTGPIIIQPSDIGKPPTPPTSTTGGGGSNPEPAPRVDPKPDTGEDLDPKVANPNGEIEIKVSRPNNNGGSRPIEGDGGNGVEALIKTAQQQFLLRKYDQAAQSYERALAAGASPLAVQQRLAQCYANMGRSGDAAAAYQRAIQALEARIKQGGDVGRYQVQLDACRRALQMLKG